MTSWFNLYGSQARLVWFGLSPTSAFSPKDEKPRTDPSAEKNLPTDVDFSNPQGLMATRPLNSQSLPDPDERRQVQEAIQTNLGANPRIADPEARETNHSFEAFYDRCRQIAGELLRGKEAGLTLQPTALANEGWIRLSRMDHWDEIQPTPLALYLARLAMRHALLNHLRGRSRRAEAGRGRVALDPDLAATPPLPDSRWSREELDAAIERLGRHKPRAAAAIELHYLVGLSTSEIKAYLNVTERTVRNDLALARASLLNILESADRGPS